MTSPVPSNSAFRGRLPGPLAVLLVAWLVPGSPVLAQDAPEPPPPAEGLEPEPEPEPEEPEVGPGETLVTPSRQKPPELPGELQSVDLDFARDTNIYELVKFFAEIKRMNFILGDMSELEGKKIQIISHKAVSANAAYEAFLSALAVSGYTTTTVGTTTKIVKTQDAATTPIQVGKGEPSTYSDSFVTQLIQLDNVSVGEVQKVVTSLAPPEAKIVAYQPTNTLIITDTANNLRKIYKILNELDVAAPKSSLEIYQIKYATSGDIKAIIEELYPPAEVGDDMGDGSRSRRTSTRRTPSRSTRRTSRTPEPTESVTAGEQGNYINKVLDDERTNALIVLANEEGHEAVVALIQKLDIDVDPQNRAQIHVVYLEHAKAEEVAQVLAELSQQGGGGRNRSQRGQTTTPARPNTRTVPGRTSPSDLFADMPGGEDGEGGGAIAAFDSGMRIAADENTNSLVIIANAEDFEVVESVISKLDIERRQVFVDAVVLELSSDDTFELGLAAHLPIQPSKDTVGIVGGQYGSNSLGLTPDLLSGLAVGVFGKSVEVPFSTGGPEGTIMIPVPAFGIVLNALKTNSSTNIVSNPNILTLDNQEAEIVVGRRIPFPTSGGFNNLGQPIVSYQREDVAITLKVTPRVNSSNFVTLETEIEVQEIEEDDQGLDTSQSGPITSKRQQKSTVLVKDNQTVVLGGLVGTTDTDVETKVPVLGDIPVLGMFFRGSRRQTRKTNLIVVLTPHIIDDEEDMLEVQRVKEAQRQEFMRRFYGRSRDHYLEEMRSLLRYSMNNVDQPSMFRGNAEVNSDVTIDGYGISDETRAALNQELSTVRPSDPGDGAGDLPPTDDLSILDEGEVGPVPDAPPAEGEGVEPADELQLEPEEG